MIPRPVRYSQPSRSARKMIFGMTFVLAAPALALEAARMALPEGFATAATRFEATGFGGHNKGEFALADYNGEFTRGESRLGVMDPLYVSSKGKSSFSIRDTSGEEILSAECRMGKKTVTIDVVTFDPKKMAYDCDFRSGGNLAGARLVLGQPKASGFKEKLFAADRRRGEAVIGDQHFTIESVHKYQGSKFSSQAPLGYLVESGGQVVAAVDLLDWNPIVFLPGDLQEGTRRSAIVVALALAVLRDPANSALED